MAVRNNAQFLTEAEVLTRGGSPLVRTTLENRVE